MQQASRPQQRRTGRPKLSEVESRLHSLLDMAAEVFIHHGYAATSMDLVAKRAGVSKATIYAHFHNKVGLLKAVVDQVLKHRTTPIDQPLHARDGIAALEEQVANNIAAALEPAYVGLFRLYLIEGQRFPGIFDAFTARGEPHQLIVKQLDEHAEFETLRPYKDAIASTLLNLIGMIVTTAAAQPGYAKTVSVDAEASRMVNICLYGYFGICQKTSP